MFTSLAGMPTRATSSITLSALMLNVPLGIYTSTEETRVPRKEFFNGDASIPVGRSPIRQDTGEVIHQTDVVRMAQASNGTWVELTDDEIAACTAPKGVAEVVSFVPVKEFGSYLTEKLYQVRPKVEKGKPNRAAVQALALLFAGMKARKVGALVQLAMRGPARYAILTSEGDLMMILTADAIRKPIPLDDDFKFTKPEVEMATNLIDAIGVDAPIITDDTAPVVQEYVDAKAGGAPTAKVTPPAAIDNLMEAFQASIDAAKAGKGKAA
jgi:non-homologous end joining protein Ku